MDEVLREIANAYDRAILDRGKQPELLLLVSFLLTFAFIRVSTHLIRRGVKWWPRNVEVKGRHIHHMVFGIILLLAVGYAAIGFAPPSPGREILAVLFGIGAGLTLDEFALWLNLKDVYWTEQGRSSIDAVIVAAVCGGLVILGLRIWVDLGRDVAEGVRWTLAASGVVSVVLAVINVTKGKVGMAVVSLIFPAIGAVGTLRLARPHSPWARFYPEHKLERSRRRFADRRRWAKV